MGTLDAEAVIKAIYHVQKMCESWPDLVGMLVRALKPLFEPSMVSLLTPLVAIDEKYAQKVLMGLYSQPAPPIDVKPLEMTTEGYIVHRLETLYWSTLIHCGLITPERAPIKSLIVPLPKTLWPDFEMEVRTSAPHDSSAGKTVPLGGSGANVPSTSSNATSDDGSSSSKGDSENITKPPLVEVIKAHSWLLYARWPYFRRMVAAGLCEVESRIMQIPDDTWSLATVRGFLRYVYSNNVGLFEGSNIGMVMRSEILTHAELFNLMDHENTPTPSFAHLIELARAPLSHGITVKNAVLSYKRLLHYGSPDQRIEVIKFMAKNIAAIMSDSALCAEFAGLGTETCTAVLFAMHNKKITQRSSSHSAIASSSSVKKTHKSIASTPNKE